MYFELAWPKGLLKVLADIVCQLFFGSFMKPLLHSKVQDIFEILPYGKIVLIFCMFLWIMVVIVWYLDLQLPLQSVPITIEASSNPAKATCTRYNIMW